MQQKVEEQVKKPLQVETEIVQVQHLVQVEESDQTKESLQVEESVQVEEPVQVKEIESEQVKEPEQAMKIEQVNEPEPVIEIEQMPEHVTQQANESEQETIVLDIAQRRPSYVPEITLADITEELDISKCETLEIPEKTQREAARSILLEKSINSVIPRTQSATISTHESVDDESVVYYKRHEDFHPKIETLTPSASTNTAQRKRYSL
ncbi:hypothetical protein INT48_006346 [Thamnidium elegans]|uniref:Uncharacterized protein n=1 Tax=Thamnidium elegans TaxID=101142 RepID=A0A8H7SML9_9FUNG|nr:hypothetical protein INT48_006346 [Thamnidium elegans]